jgi:hypothetical protein
MSGADIKAHKQFARFVSLRIPLLATSRLVRSIQKAAGNYPAAKIKRALQWNTPPGINIKAFAVTQTAGGQTRVHGGYTEKSNILDISAYDVALYEDGQQDRRTTPKGTQVHLIEVVLLHEFVHWVKEQVGGAGSIGVEEGYEFEKDFYGGILKR